MPTWLLLAAAIASEVVGTIALKATDGFTRLAPSLVVFIGYALSFYLLALILKTGLATGVVYAIWSAFGIALVTLGGVWLYKESISLVTVLGLGIVIVGVVVVQLGSSGGAH
jgi:small multidrug resistance pump